MANKLIAILPKTHPDYEKAIADAGGELSEMNAEVRGVIWTDYSNPQGLEDLITQNPQLEWVQLPFAGVDAFSKVIQIPIRFTSAKGSYREPVAEHALALALALGRKLPERVKAHSWGRREARSFYDANVVIVGGGGIAKELTNLLTPFRCQITIVRNRVNLEEAPLANTVGFSELTRVISSADLVVIACALTEKTKGLFNFSMISKMKESAFLVNVARGPIIVTEDLLKALDQKVIAGAAVDVTDPEPLPAGHPMFGREDLIVTPHTADTKEIVTPLFANRIRENVAAYLGKGPWIGLVDGPLGY